MTPEDKTRYQSVATRLARADRLLDAATLLAPGNLADWLDHLDAVLSNIDTRLAHIEKRLDTAGLPPLADGVPDDEVLAYFGLYVVNPVSGTDSTEPPGTLQHRLAAFRGTQPGEESSS